MNTREKLLGSPEVKGLLERSGVRAFLAMVIIVIVNAWSHDESIVDAVRERANEMAGLLLVALGLSANPSGKSSSEIGEHGVEHERTGSA